MNSSRHAKIRSIAVLIVAALILQVTMAVQYFSTRNAITSEIMEMAETAKTEPVFDTIPTINSTEDGTFGAWDLSEPVFALYRQNAAKTHWEQSEFDKNYYAEAIGNNSGVGSTLDRIEFHLQSWPCYHEYYSF